MKGPKERPRPPGGGFTRRDAIMAGFVLLGGGFAAERILPPAQAPPPGAEPAPEDPEELLALPDRDLLCLADAVLDLPGPPRTDPAWRKLLLRILAASIEFPSDENDLLAARALLLLGRAGGITPAVETLVRNASGAPLARAALERTRRGGKEGS